MKWETPWEMPLESSIRNLSREHQHPPPTAKHHCSRLHEWQPAYGTLSVVGCFVFQQTWTTGIGDHGGSVREDKAQSNGEPTLRPFAFDVPDILSSQPASEVVDNLDTQNGLPPAQVNHMCLRLGPSAVLRPPW